MTISTDAPSCAGGPRTIFIAKEHGVSNDAPRLRMFPVLRVILQVWQFARPPYRDLQALRVGECAGVHPFVETPRGAKPRAGLL
jgi:hypothetical protein